MCSFSLAFWKVLLVSISLASFSTNASAIVLTMLVILWIVPIRLLILVLPVLACFSSSGSGVTTIAIALLLILSLILLTHIARKSIPLAVLYFFQAQIFAYLMLICCYNMFNVVITLMLFLNLFLFYPVILSIVADSTGYVIIAITKLVLLSILLISSSVCLNTMFIVLIILISLVVLASSMSIVGVLAVTGNLMFALILLTDLDSEISRLFVCIYTLMGISFVVYMNIAINSVFSMIQFITLIGIPINSLVLLKLLILTSLSLSTALLLIVLLILAIFILATSFSYDRNYHNLFIRN